ncbi:MAG TPA: 2'-5' RNA ligase family protein [Candidatus Sulfotelmatobacter sp.]|jgi:2'-5' RNA ligase
MHLPRYALVAYVKGPTGEFVEDLRAELHSEPGRTPFVAHLTILPPRTLSGSESSAIQLLEHVCGEEDPFGVTLGAVETFIPVTPTVFIRVETPAEMNQLHARLNTDVLACREEWPYIPHLTIAKMSSEQAAVEAFDLARRRWEQYSGSRRVLLEKLTFVREDAQNCWSDLAPIQLGRSLVSR